MRRRVAPDREGLGISRVVQGMENKLDAWEQLRAELALEPEECAHIGDDLPDLAVIVRCGLAATVPHAPEALQRRAHYVTRAEGGAGAVRELAELILAAQGKLAELLNAYGDQDALAVKPKRARNPKPKQKPPQPLPPWKVLLHNDDKNEMMFVVFTVVIGLI